MSRQRLRAVVATAVIVAAGFVVLPGSAQAGSPTCDSPLARRDATIVGTAGPDVIHGTSHRDVIVARGGGDIVYGDGGRDILCGGAGDDVLRGGADVDSIRGGPGADDIYRGRFSNYHGWGEHVWGGSGDDLVHAAGGGLAGVERSSATTWTSGGKGEDTIRGSVA